MATYRVKAGDNLWDIAENLFGDGRAMKRIMYLNNMKGDTTIRPGMVLKLPTIIKGRNDRFRITNADIASSQAYVEKYGGQAIGLGQQRDDGTFVGGYGGPGQTQQEPEVEKTARERLAEQGISFQDTSYDKAQNLSVTNGPAGSARQYADPYITQRKFSDSNKDAPFRTPAGVSPTVKPKPKPGQQAPGEMARQYIPKEFRPAPREITSNTNAPFRTPATIGFTTENTKAPMTQALDVIKMTIQKISEASQASNDQFRKYRDIVVDEFGDAFNPPEPVGSFTGGGAQQASLESWMRGEDVPEELLPPEGSGTLSETSINAWKNFKSEYTNSMYGENLTQRILAEGTLPRIPAGAVTGPGFTYTPEQLRLMGYTLSEDGQVYNPPEEGTGTQESGLGSSGSGISYGSGGGGYGSGGGGGGGSGYGGGSNTIGSGNKQNQINNSVEAILKGVGSWKGASFG